MTEKRLDYDLLWNNYYQVIELDDEDTDYLRRLSPTEIIKRLNEQQDTIFKLQDICGKSDGENMKLRIENKRLQEEIKLLKPTNIEQYEQIQKLRKELGDCEKFRYTVFKRMRDVLDE